MRRVYADGWIVTCDDAATEHPSGWLLVEDGVIEATGAGDEPEADERIDLGGAVVTHQQLKVREGLREHALDRLGDKGGGVV